MKKIQHLLLTSLISVIYFCKKESKENKAINNDNRIVVIDSRAVKRLTKEENDKTYTEIKNTKTSGNYAGESMQRFIWVLKTILWDQIY